jgi:xanthine dehydrogenase YagR molybdenum-binding subunit
MIWGLGQALMEESVPDERAGAWANGNLAEALVPTNLDVPSIEPILIEEDDSRASSLGVKGIGEIGITGVAAAIANAVYNATGQRQYELPIKPDVLLRRPPET